MLLWRLVFGSKINDFFVVLILWLDFHDDAVG